jgi:hypothetical protein
VPKPPENAAGDDVCGCPKPGEVCPKVLCPKAAKPELAVGAAADVPKLLKRLDEAAGVCTPKDSPLPKGDAVGPVNGVDWPRPPKALSPAYIGSQFRCLLLIPHLQLYYFEGHFGSRHCHHYMPSIARVQHILEIRSLGLEGSVKEYT